MKKEIVQAHKWNIADTITALRMMASLILLFFPVRSVPFFVVYTIAGLTDVIDGWMARKRGLASEFGARLDSMADLLFYGILLVRLMPILWQTLPKTIWYVVTIALLVRLSSYATAMLKYHRFASLHTWLNKLTGGAVFLLPYVILSTIGVIYSWAVCALALVSSAEELLMHLCLKDYCANRKSIFQVD